METSHLGDEYVGSLLQCIFVKNIEGDPQMWVERCCLSFVALDKPNELSNMTRSSMRNF